MAHVYLGTVIDYLRGRQARRTSLSIAAVALLGLGTSAFAQTSDIRSYGARCDGSDDSGALNAAFNSLSNGGTLLLNCTLGIGPSGVVLHNKQNVTVDGSGGSLRALSNNNAAMLFRVEVCDGCTMRNLSIEANNTGAGGISIFWSSNSTIQNTMVANTSLPAVAAIVGMGNRGNRYIGNTVAGTRGNGSDGARGMWFGNLNSQLVEWNPVIMNNTIYDAAATGMVLQASGGATVSGNRVERTQGSGIKVEPPQDSNGQVVIQGNTFRNNLYHGVQIYRSLSPVTIQNNTIEGNTMTGVYSSGGAFNGGQITGNTFNGNVQGNIFLYDGRDLSIQNNQLNGGGNGIVIEANSASSLGNMQISSNTINGASYDGITLRGRGGYMSGVGISGNSISNNRRYGLAIEEFNSGAFTNVGLNNTCFSGNVVGALLDLRMSDRLSVSSSSSCGSAAQTQTQTQQQSTTTTTTTTPPPTTTTAPPPPTTTTPPPTTSTTSSTSTMTPIRVNAGGGQYTDSNGNLWSGDYGSGGGYNYVVSSGISNTNSQPLYQAVRWNDRVLDYNFQVPSGARTVTLKFSETYFTSPRQRVFNVSINGQTVLWDFDIVAEGGRNTAVDRTFQVQSSGQISIHMASTIDDPVISAIEIK
jgi:parallel beta-helix repeat protein